LKALHKKSLIGISKNSCIQHFDKKIFIWIWLFLLSLCNLASAQPLPKHGLHYETPAMVWDEALPLGNGLLGALVWGDGKPIKLSLDRTDLWDLRPVEMDWIDSSFICQFSGRHERRIRKRSRVYVSCSSKAQ
jgi:hypothetical protein